MKEWVNALHTEIILLNKFQVKPTIEMPKSEELSEIVES